MKLWSSLKAVSIGLILEPDPEMLKFDDKKKTVMFGISKCRDINIQNVYMIYNFHTNMNRDLLLVEFSFKNNKMADISMVYNKML